MIIRDQPSALRLFLVMQGSVVPRIFGKIVAVALLSVAILLIDQRGVRLPRISVAATSVFGVALSLFLGFRNNAAYDRWWEARKLWGGIIGGVRTLARDATIFLRDPADRADLLDHATAFAHLHRHALRGRGMPGPDDLSLEPEPAQAMLACRNPADAALRAAGERIGALRTSGELSDFGQMTMARTLAELGAAQAGGERIATTPLPFVYSLLVRRTTYLYCFLLPFALIDAANWLTPVFVAAVAYTFFGLQTVTHELEHPFGIGANALPLDALCHVVDISVAEALGRPAPEPLRPVNYLLL